METQTASPRAELFRKLVVDPKVHLLSKADKMTIIVGILHRCDPELFNSLDNLTWPEGQAILISRNRSNIERTNRTAQIKPVLNSGFFIDTGHDNEAMRRLVEIMMRQLGVESGLITQCKSLFTVKKRGEFSYW